MADNPIKYSDLVQPDNSIMQAIEQLKQLQTEYGKAMENIKKKAEDGATSLKKVSGATEEGKKKIAESATEVDKLAQMQARLTEAQSANAKEIAKLKLAIQEQNKANKEQAKLAQAQVGSYNQLSAQYSRLKKELNNVSAVERANNKVWKEKEQEARRIYEQMKRLQEATGKYSLNVGNYANSFKQAFNELKQGKDVVGNLGTMFSSGLRGGVQKATSSVMDMGSAFASSLLKVNLIMTAWQKMGEVISYGANVIIDFEHENSRLQAILGESKEGITQLEEEAKRLGAETQYTASEVTQLEIELAKLGFRKDEILNMTEAVLKFSLATGSDLASASALAGAELRAFGASSQETERYVSAMAVSTTKSALSFSYLQTALPIVSGAAKAMNFSIEDTLAILGKLADTGMDASMAATSTRNIILKLADANSSLAKTLGHPVKNADELADALKELNDKGIDLATSLELTDKRSVVAFSNLIKNAEGIKTLRKEVTGCQGDLNKMAETMEDNVQGSINKMKSAWESLMLSFSESKGWMKSAIDGITKLINSINGLFSATQKINNMAQRLDVNTTNGKSTIKSQLDRLGGSKNKDVVNKENLEYYYKQIRAYNKEREKMLDENGQVKFGYGDLYKENRLRYKAVEKNLDEYRKKANAMMNPVSSVTTPTTNNVDVPLTDKELETQESAREKAKREAEKAYQDNLKAKRAYEDSMLALDKDGHAKEETELERSYDRQIEDLQHQLQTDEKLNTEGKSAITNKIVALQAQRAKAIQELSDKYDLKDLNLQKQQLENEAELAESADAQLEKKLQLLEVERQIALLQNKQKPEGERQSESSINASFNAKGSSLKYSAEMASFQGQQALAQSEFDLLKTTEAEKTKFKLQAEKERLQKELELQSKYGKTMSDEEIKTIQNQIKKVEEEMNKPREIKDIYDLVGLKMTDETKEAVDETISYVTEQLSSILDSYAQLAEQEYESAQQRTEDAKTALETELEARANGYASDVATAQKELALAKKEEEEKLKNKEKYTRAQENLETAQQATSLITASANIWQSMSGIPIVGTALALASIATMWTSFAIAKAKAKEVTATSEYGEGGYEFLDGGSHQSGNDIDMGMTKDGKKRRAEGGEAFAIFNKEATRKYHKEIPDIVNAINHGLFEERFGRAFHSNLSILSPDVNIDTKNLERDVAEIRRQGERTTTYMGGAKIIRYKNLTRIVR